MLTFRSLGFGLCELDPDGLSRARCERLFAVKNNRISTRGRVPLLSGAGVVAVALLSGCTSPTYGTGKTANQQLIEDISGAFSIAPTNKGSEIAYTPRAELVKPADTNSLPEPQQQVVSAENPAWPESPEQRRARIRANATANQDNMRYRGPVSSTEQTWSAAVGRGVPDAGASSQQRAEFQRRLRENRQGDPNSRRYLSEPPTGYRRPAETAVVGDLGEDERVKERRRQQGSGGNWRDWLPF